MFKELGNLGKLFVPYNETLEIIKLGFNEVCLAKFDNTSGETKFLIGLFDDIDNPHIIPAPTWEQAFQWFSDEQLDNLTTFYEDVDDENGQYHYGFEIRDWFNMTIYYNEEFPDLCYYKEDANLTRLKKLIEKLTERNSKHLKK